MKKWTSFLWILAFTIFHQCAWAVEGGDEAFPADSGWQQTLVMVGIALLFFYFILWRPEQKRRQALEDQRGSLKKGDKVIAMGIVGTILRTEDQTVILKMYDGSKIEVLKAAITETINEPAGSESKKTDDLADDQKESK